jgi:hypothetical protein
MGHLRALGFAVVALGASSALAGGDAWAASAPPTAPAPGTRYAKVHQVCPAPEPGDARCFALSLIPTAPSAPGVSAYQLAGGASSAGPAGGLTPADLASAYHYSTSAGGTGQTVAIVDAYDDPNIEKDLGTFDSQYGLSPCTTANGCFEKVSQTGSTKLLPAADQVGWSVEMSLDVETVHSVCPACKVLVVEADTETLANLAVAVNEAVSLGATEVSNSYGALEAQMGATEQSAYSHAGVVIAASSGDTGYLDWDDIFRVLEAPEMPNAPASLPSVVAVGGTSLELKANGTRKRETVWNDNGSPSGTGFKQFSASGSGCSALFTAPSWQQSAPGWASAGCGTGRLDNDIAAVADPYTGFDIYDSYLYEPSFKTGWLTVGGTSLSAPLVSALYGLAGGGHGVSDPAATLYAHLGQGASLYDVSAGGDGYCDGEAPGPCGEPAINEEFGDIDCQGTTSCDAAPGFDGPSGVGAPNGLGAFGATPQSKPTVVTGVASSVTAASALLNATVDPNGAAVSACTFEYGRTTAYGHSAPCSSPPGSGTSPVAVSAAITGLSKKARYRFRISATNPSGTSDGAARKFKTP